MFNPLYSLGFQGGYFNKSLLEFEVISLVINDS